jgi:hypothetical protein|tara:strand:- start:15318 stop:16184 length:867 start_codon:yes stop_codon:yes gene_type:complete
MSNLKTIVRGAYDIQKNRIQTGNRLVGNFKAKLGQAPNEKEDTIDKEGQQVLLNLRRAHKLLTEGVASFPRQATFKGDEVISDYTELCLVDNYLELEAQEKNHFKRLGHILKDYPIYTEFLDGVRGIGPAMAGVIISEVDITKAEYPSSLHKYAGLDVASDGQGRSRRKEHLEDSEYKDKEGKVQTKKGITFNPFLKTKLTGVLGASFLKQSPDKCKYRQVYDDYKHRLEHMDAHKEKSKGHRHNMAIRYMIKMFLIDLYNEWRPLEGLPVAPTYTEAKLGKVHGKAA